MHGDDQPVVAGPAELREFPQWVLWRYEVRNGKRTKVPCDPRSRRRASSTDPTTWAALEEAIAALHAGAFDGIGFVFSEADPFCGIDLDRCVDAHGALEPWARQVVDRMSTYTEVSPSGRGVKLFLRGSLPPGGNRKGQVEMYDRARFFTVTGRHLAGTPTTIEDRQAELEALHAEVFRRQEPPRPQRAVARACRDEDERLLARARSARNGRRFMDLYYRGDTSAYGGDDSAADLALCGLLAFWCGRDTERIDRLFRGSTLMREKWDSRRRDTTYGALTIAKALRGRHG